MQFRNSKDLAERTAKFGEAIITFVQGLPGNPVLRVLIVQLIRSGTSIGANYMEADAAQSRRDFLNKIALCKKEAKETMHWLRMDAHASPEHKDECRKLWQEAHELCLIFSTIGKRRQ